ncbi:hypothetical protein DFH06DRAFT_1226895 [Mycena polygramma]|nr:hypothetical protein DFH06DRAFT_1226895 [Mycena polygramma]
MVQFTRIFALLAVASVALAASVKRDIGPTTSCMAALTTQAKVLTTAITVVNGSNVATIANVHVQAGITTSQIQGCGKVVDASSVWNESDGAIILTEVINLENQTVIALAAIVAAVSQLAKVATVVKMDLGTLANATYSFLDVLASKAPADDISKLNAIRAQLVIKFNSATATYN